MLIARRRQNAGFLAVLALVLFGAVVGSGLAGASPLSSTGTRQACDDAYGCPPTTPPPGPSVHCAISANEAHVGDTVIVTVTNVAVGTEISVAIDGTVVATAVATADGQGHQVAAALAPAGHLSARQSGSGGAVISFTVPAWLTPGSHTLVVFGAAFSCVPSPSGFRVLGETEAADQSVERAKGDAGGGSLARTGMFIALLLAIALVLLLLGYLLVQSARRRRRRKLREDNRLTV